jgi:hypothetical protein
MPIAPFTSVSITNLGRGAYEMAYQGYDGDLITVGPSGTTASWGPPAPGTSPSMTPLFSTAYEVAHQLPDGNLATSFCQVREPSLSGCQVSVMRAV